MAVPLISSCNHLHGIIKVSCLVRRRSWQLEFLKLKLKIEVEKGIKIPILDSEKGRKPGEVLDSRH